MNSESYWEKKIIEWENSMQSKRNISFIEKLASFFRKPVKFRTEMCLKILEPLAREKTMLELGCGSGFFAFELYEKSKPEHIIGIDFSDNAIRRAQNIALRKNLANKFTFLKEDAVNFTFPPADVTFGLGFLDYLSLVDIKRLFDNIKSEYFIFTFVERKFSLMRYFHVLYLWSQKCPKHFYYLKNEIISCINDRFQNVKFLNDVNLSFGCIVHNLPIAKSSLEK